jgi:chromosome segregation ATPase
MFKIIKKKSWEAFWTNQKNIEKALEETRRIHHEKMHEQNATIFDLTAQIKELEKDLKESVDETSTLQETIRFLEKKIREKIKENKQLRAEYTKFRKENLELCSENDELNEVINAIKNYIKKYSVN